MSLRAALACVLVALACFVAAMPVGAEDPRRGSRNRDVEVPISDGERAELVAIEDIDPNEYAPSTTSDCDTVWEPFDPGTSIGIDVPQGATVHTGFLSKTVDGVLYIYYHRFCDALDPPYQATWASIGLTVESLALEARELLIPPLPVPHFAPPAATARTIVGIDTWFWMPEEQWGPITERAQAGAVWVEATATPILIHFTPGDGSSTVTCEGPGVAWEPDAERGDCWYVYQYVSAHDPTGSWPATLEVEWDVTWLASDGQTGVLDPLVSTADLNLLVEEVQITVHSPSLEPAD